MLPRFHHESYCLTARQVRRRSRHCQILYRLLILTICRQFGLARRKVVPRLSRMVSHWHYLKDCGTSAAESDLHEHESPSR